LQPRPLIVRIAAMKRVGRRVIGFMLTIYRESDPF
jgi:hypothetical protein